jgi:DNA-binding NarL/FixJ family response regulator
MCPDQRIETLWRGDEQTVVSEAALYRVVLVDDATSERELLAIWLEESRRFVVVGEASDGPGGVEMTASLRPELVVLDLSMPGGDGLQALSQVLSASPATRVVVFSGFLSASLAGGLLRLGASGCLDKSVGHQRLIEELLRVVGDGHAHAA